MERWNEKKAEILALLDKQAAAANMLARLYEDAAQTVAGFRSEAEYQEHAEDAFEAAQESHDDFLRSIDMVNVITDVEGVL